MSRYKLSEISKEISVRVDDPQNSGYDKFVGLEHYDSGEVTIKRYGDPSKLGSSMKVFQAGDILLARRNVYLKRAGLVDFDGLTSGDSIVIRAQNDSVRRLLPFILNTPEFWKFAIQNADGPMSKRLSPKLLMDYEVELPDSDEDRNKLADVLWSVNDTLDVYKELLDKSTEVEKAFFANVIEKSASLKKYKIKEVLSQYKETEKIQDTKAERYISVALYGKGISERDLGNDDLKAFTGVRIKTGQFVYSRIWVRKGACGIVPDELNGAVVTNEFPVYDIDINKVEPIFLLHYILNEKFVSQMGVSSLGTTSKQRLKESVFAELNLEIPVMDEQKRYVAFVRKNAETRKDLAENIEKLTSLLLKIVVENLSKEG